MGGKEGVSREGAQVREGTACTPPLQALQVCFPRDEAQTPSTAPRHRGPYLQAHTPCYSPTGQRFQIPVFLQKGSLLWGLANSPADPNSSVILSLERKPAPLPACCVHSSTATGLQFPLCNSLSARKLPKDRGRAPASSHARHLARVDTVVSFNCQSHTDLQPFLENSR